MRFSSLQIDWILRRSMSLLLVLEEYPTRKSLAIPVLQKYKVIIELEVVHNWSLEYRKENKMTNVSYSSIIIIISQPAVWSRWVWHECSAADWRRSTNLLHNVAIFDGKSSRNDRISAAGINVKISWTDETFSDQNWSQNDSSLDSIC